MSLFLRDHPDHASALDHLTQRERSVLAPYAQGYTIKEIAGELNVSVKTAETHRSKLGHPNRSQITALSTYLNFGRAGRRNLEVTPCCRIHSPWRAIA